MSSSRKPYKTFPKEFKLEALRLMAESDRPASEIAMQLGIRAISFINGRNKWQKMVKLLLPSEEDSNSEKNYIKTKIVN